MRSTTLTLLCLAACSEPASSLGPPPSIPIETASFHDHFELVATLTPVQSEANPVVYLSGGLITPQHIGIVDVSQGNAKLFNRDGALQTVLGRKGEGPGEFESPRYLLEDAAGRIIVGDAGTPRITTFDLAGDTVPEIVRAPIPWLGGLAVTSDGSFVMSTIEIGPDAEHVVAIMARGSDTVTTHFPIGGTLPRGTSDPAPWRSLTVFSATVLADTIFVTSSISDSLWVRAPTGEMAAYHLQIPGYEMPHDPESPLSSAAELQTWSGSFHTATSPLSGDGFLLLQFVKGVLNFWGSRNRRVSGPHRRVVRAARRPTDRHGRRSRGARDRKSARGPRPVGDLPGAALRGIDRLEDRDQSWRTSVLRSLHIMTS